MATSPGLSAYLEGLDALSEGREPDAVAAFSRALDASGDDPTFVLARGVAETLAEQFPQAQTDLSRAKRLGLPGREAELWTYALEAMSGNVGPDHTIGGPRALPGAGPPAAAPGNGVVSIPGHMAQGRDDYPTDYASFVIYDLAMPYQKARLPPDRGGSGDRSQLESPAIRNAIRRAGAWFASLRAKRPDLAAAHLARARALTGDGHPREALRELDFARAAFPGDPDVRYLTGHCWLALGRPATARRELTIALTQRTTFAAAYADRAVAAAKLGDAKRAKADLDVAAKLDSGSMTSARATVEGELARHHADGDPAQLLTQLETAAGAGSPTDSLLGAAQRVEAASGERRLRYDEGYQDRLRVLEAALASDPSNADKHVDLARYLVVESENRGEAVEPRRAVELYRWQASREAELGRAVKVLDEALAANPDHAKALIWKASAIDELGQQDEAEKLVERGAALTPKDPEVLKLAARFRARRANRAAAQAAALRQDRCSSASHTEDRSDGTYEVTTTTCYPPSQGDLARADQLDQLAVGLRQQAHAALDAAVAVTKGAEKAMLQADLELWFGTPDHAIEILEQAVAAEPASLEAQEKLSDLYAKTGQHDRAEEQLAVARQLVHTTAAPLLRLAWARIEKTAWQGAKTELAKARELDLADARVPAYLAVALAADGKTNEAANAFRVAIALETARLGFDDPDSGELLPRDPIDLGLLLTVRGRLAAIQAQRGQNSDALALSRANARDAERIAHERWLDFVYSAMLPDPSAAPGAPPPQPLVAAALIADAHRGAARAFDATGKADEAAQEYSAVLALGPLLGAENTGKPRIGTAAEPPRNTREHGGDAVPEAALWLAKNAMAKGDADAAYRALNAATGTFPPGYNPDLQELWEAVRRAKDQQMQQQRDPYAGMSPEMRGYAQQQQARDQERTRMAARQMAANARVDPALVGTWTATPQNRFTPGGFTLTIDAAAHYTFTPRTGGAPTSGSVQAMRGSILLIDGTSGEMRQSYYELSGPDAGVWTDLDSTKYGLVRSR